MITLVGAGGHAKVVLDALLARGESPSSLAIRDGDAALAGSRLMGIAIATPEWPEDLEGTVVHLALGDCQARLRLAWESRKRGGRLETIVHPAAVVARTARIDAGCFVAAGAVIGPFAAIGISTIVNHNAVIDHDCLVGDCCHIAPNATLGGGVHIGAGTLVGSGAVILPGCKVGEGAVIGAGAVVTRDVPAGELWIGVPARAGGEITG